MGRPFPCSRLIPKLFSRAVGGTTCATMWNRPLRVNPARSDSTPRHRPQAVAGTPATHVEEPLHDILAAPPMSPAAQGRQTHWEAPLSEFSKVLVANRGEIAIRVLRAANEMGKSSVAVFAEEDKLSLHRFKADESYRIGVDRGPVSAYLDIEEILRVARETRADAVHPGYGFLSESPEFAEACARAKITFIGPSPETLRLLGDKVSARQVAESAGVPTVPATGPLPADVDAALALAERVGFPAMLKASWGGGGRGMRIVENAGQFADSLRASRREALAAFGKDDVFLERLVLRARHVEVQILADSAGRVVHLFERDCSVQRRNQKLVECAPAPYLGEEDRERLCGYAIALARESGYCNAGTVEFLFEPETGQFHFIEVNPRIQVEHTVTEMITGVDIVRAQIRISEGGSIGDGPSDACPPQQDLSIRGNAIQCRITTEDPHDHFIPDYGRITAYRGATGFGIRLDGGTAYSGAVITRHYDSLLEKVTAWGSTWDSAISRLARALREFRIRGVATNLAFLQRVVDHQAFREGRVTTRFIDDHPELLDFPRPRDRATRLLRHIAQVTVNGHPEARGRPTPRARARTPVPPEPVPDLAINPAKTVLEGKGPEAVAQWMRESKRLLITDTTMRDAPQSLLATRMRSYDLLQAADAYNSRLLELFSLECWGGATFDVAMRFLDECPWERLENLRNRIPNQLLQMLLRASNAVGYTNYPDNVITEFVAQSAKSGIDLFRIFDPLNSVDNMRVAIDAVLETGRICEGAICYTGDLHDPARSKYNLDYYLGIARSLQSAGVHILCIKDMAGLLKPAAAPELVRALREETGLPVHLHTHDTSGISAATILAAAEAGVDAVDLAMDSFSGLTSQPPLGSIVEALKGRPRATGLDPALLRKFSEYWESVRDQYAAYEADLRAPASEVYLHEMPGGQFTNLRAQAEALGLLERWHEVAAAYAEVNAMFGDIVKVTPTSKVVGDLALAMVASGLTREQVEDPDVEVAFPESVIGLFRGELGTPPGGFPSGLSNKILRGCKPLSERPGAAMAPADFRSLRAEAERKAGRKVSERELLSYILYPKVFTDYAGRRRTYGPVSVLPTPVYFYGLRPGQEISVELERGMTLVIRCLAIGETDAEGSLRVFYELNGQPRSVRIQNETVAETLPKRVRADPSNPAHLAAPMPGVIASVAVSNGQRVVAGDMLLTIEAMKMETALNADNDGVIKELHVAAGQQVDAKDLLLEFAGG